MSTILLPELRFRILQLLPISSPRLHLFRRRLACAFVFEDASRMTTPYENLLPLGKLATMVERQTPYKIQQSTNYTALRALISILDVAIDNGATAGTVKDKDADVDKITVILKNMFSKILDTNAQNIPRTETKDVIERLQFRLTFAVRSKQKMAMDILGNYEQTKLPFSKKKEMVVSPKTEEEVAVKAEGEDVKMEDVKVDAEI